MPCLAYENGDPTSSARHGSSAVSDLPAPLASPAGSDLPAPLALPAVSEVDGCAPVAAPGGSPSARAIVSNRPPSARVAEVATTVRSAYRCVASVPATDSGATTTARRH